MDHDYERAWPTQRIRIALASTLMFGVEVVFARQLPLSVAFGLLAIGVLSTMSAFNAIYDLRAAAQGELVLDTLEVARASQPPSR